MDGPVGPSGLGELAGAVERVDDPDPVGVDACGVVRALLGQDRVVGALDGQALEQQVVGAEIAFVAELVGIDARCPQLDEELSRRGREGRGKIGVGHTRAHPRPNPSGCAECHCQAEEMMSSSPSRGCQPSSSIARVVSATRISGSPARLGAT